MNKTAYNDVISKWLVHEDFSYSHLDQVSCCTDINGKDWIILVCHSEIRLYRATISSDRCQIRVKYERLLRNKHRHVHLDFKRIKWKLHAIDTNNHILYVYCRMEGNKFDLMLTIDIQDCKNVKLIDSTNDHVHDLRMVFIGHDIHFMFLTPPK